MAWNNTGTGRSAYSFCMCPGGEVVAGSSEEGGVVTNGMSSYRRNSPYANSALVVSVGRGDFVGESPLAGIEFQRLWERKAFAAGGMNYRAPAQNLLAFLGDTVIAVQRLLRGKAQYRRTDLGLIMQAVSAQALPIVSLICFLVGLILAFIGAIQLQLFGAQIYVADLVGIAMVRLMAAIMTGIVMAGRTGGAFAAQLGTMQVNQEIDALKTLGISPMEFLVLPRILALVLMMPVLCVYADIMGIIGGMIVGVGMLNLGLVEYLHQTQASLSLSYFWIGLLYSAVFGVLIALSGCLRGMQCGRSASAVGDATTPAVVTSIVAIVVATAIITFARNVIGI